MYIDECRDHFVYGLRATRDEYAALRKAGYGQWTIAKMAAGDADEYALQIEARPEDEHQHFLRGCLAAAKEVVEREMAA